MDEVTELMNATFKRWVCRRKLLWIGLLAFTLMHLVMGLLAASSIERGSANYYILVIDFGLIAVLLAIIALVFWWCGYLGDDTPLH